MPSTSPTLTSGLSMKDRQGISPGRKIRHFFDAKPISIEKGVTRALFGFLSSCFLCGALAKSHIPSTQAALLWGDRASESQQVPGRKGP